MGIETTLMEIVPTSSLFEMLMADGEWAGFVFMLPDHGKRVRGEFFQENAETLQKFEPFFKAIEDMYTAEPCLLERTVELYKDEHRFREPLEIVATNDRERGMVKAIFYGERDLAPEARSSIGVPVRWVDGARCMEIASWLRTISEETIAKAAFEAYSRRYDTSEEWSDADVKEGLYQFGMIGKLRRLFDSAGREDNVVVVCIH